MNWEACPLADKGEMDQPRRIPAGPVTANLTELVVALHCWWSGAYCLMPTAEAAAHVILHANWKWTDWKVRLKALVIELDSGLGRKKKKGVMLKVGKGLAWMDGAGYKEHQLD